MNSLKSSSLHCYFCFNSLFESWQEPELFNEMKTIPNQDEKCALFVTWHRNDTHHWQLAGCIGQFSLNQPLFISLNQYALLAAKDKRFEPLNKNDIQLSLGRSIQCTVSLLSSFEKCTNWYDWEWGVDGLKCSFESETKSFSSTFLPQVALEQGWSKQETLQQLLVKAGWRKKELPRDFILERYKSHKTSKTFQDYLNWHKNGRNET